MIFQHIWDEYYNANGKVWPVVKDIKAFMEHLDKIAKSTSTVVTTFSHLPAKKNFPKVKVCTALATLFLFCCVMPFNVLTGKTISRDVICVHCVHRTCMLVQQTS